MKKIIALILSLCLLCGTVALAAEQTIVTYTIEANEGYILTVPATTPLNQNEGGPTGYVDVKLDATGFNVAGKTISVALTGAAFKLVNGENEMAYSIMMGTNKGNNVSGGQEVTLNDTILSWTYGDADAVAGTDLRIHVASSALDGLAAGDYSDTLTFTASVSTNGGGLEGWAPDSDDSEFGE